MYEEKEYKRRLIDDKIEEFLDVFGALIIEGPKWVGKTWTAYKHTNTQVTLAEESFRNLASSNPKFLFTDKSPQLIDEWQLVPQVWDCVRNECDKRSGKGHFILTGSTSLSNKKKQLVFHSGAGRFARMRMYPMSLYESGDSIGKVSLLDLYNGKMFDEGIILELPDLREIARLCVKGGWPENVSQKDEKIFSKLPKHYIDAICNDDFYDEEYYSPFKLNQTLLSLARNESTLTATKTILNDIKEYDGDEDLLSSKNTLAKYLDYLKRLYVIDDVNAFSLNYKSTARLGKNSKRHLVDPSLSCALLKLSSEKLMMNHTMFGYIFESLVLRDLRIYMDYLDGAIYHFRDNLSGDEVDAILEFEDGEFACCEIKLTHNLIDEGKKSLLKFYKTSKVKPKFMCIICGDINYAIKDPETGIYIIPITALRP